MVLFMILVMTLAILGVVLALGISIGGAAIIIVFGDVIICMALIIWILRKLIKRRKK